MPSIKEISVEQRRQLIRLLKIKKGETDIDTAINEMEAEMEQEEVAFVRQKILGEGEKK